LEGIVAKKKDSQYEEGLRTGSWLKIKKVKTCDAIIFGYTRGGGVREDSFGALLLGVYDKTKPVYLGKVGSGFSQETIRLLIDKFIKIKTNVVPFKPEAGDVVTWLEPKLVCEVYYQVLTRDLKLRMARFQRLRDDKKSEQCTLDQIVEAKKLEKTADRKNSESQTDKLSQYSSKRNFGETPEPKGGGKKEGSLIYVIQEHHSRRLHYDFRLEKDGVLKSWAVPKGIPEDSKQRHLAVQTEDHPYEYASFAGTIPKGQYGAGTVIIWDKGHYTTKLWEDDKIEVNLIGERLKGRYVLVRLKNAKEDNAWLMLKGKD